MISLTKIVQIQNIDNVKISEFFAPLYVLFYVYFMLIAGPSGNNLRTICSKDFLGLATMKLDFDLKLQKKIYRSNHQ